ncbi:unnamed protein product [Coffea canephora]|uniref:Protein kinase domain-containing protein n=1 Tax=Coffea canephora TaxID=49390 RepID=A0A068UJ08_COFCA|nr:unnamed protein product [Coffea canephora]
MAKKVLRAQEAFFAFIFMFIFLNSWRTCQSSELQLLQTIKASFKDPLRSLSNWNSSLSFCQWHGVSCDSLSHVNKIELSAKNLTGRVPETIFQLQHVETINLSSNQLSGSIPDNLSSCLSLKHLNLSNNNITGPLPKGSIPFLETYDLSNNMLSGAIPENIGLLSGLRVLDFGGNVLEGRIPKSITNLTSLQVLTLASNQLVGEIPPELGLMKNLTWMYLGYNNFSGGIPTEIGELTSLHHLDLVNNNLTGEIPSSLGNLINLQHLFLYLNKLTGPIPKSIFGLKSLISLDLSDNFLSGEIPEDIFKLQNLEVLQLFSNNFTGSIPRALSSLPHLKVLQLWSNKLSGTLPEDLGRYNNLTILDLSTNNLTGKIPEMLCESGSLFKLILFSNFIEGEIPQSLCRCKSLQRVRLQNNKLSGELPPEFTRLPLVYFLDISGNNLGGTIKEPKWNMPAIQMLNMARNQFSGEIPESFGSNKLENLDLSDNDFSGSVPQSIGTFSELAELKLGQNKLSGKIPDELSSCKKLVALDLSHNQLSGEIPISLSEMPVLGLLDLSVNQLSGEIPGKLGTVGSLVQINISHNHLRGSLPSTGAFLAINSSSVEGNDLCGGDETTGLPPCKRRKNPAWWLFPTCLLAVLVAFALAAFIVTIGKRRKKMESKRTDSEDGTWEVQFFSSKALKSMTTKDIFSSMKDENLIARGRKGTIYKGNCSIGGSRFVTTVFGDVNSVSPASYWTEAEEFGRLHHPNVVKLIAACRSGKGGILIHEYIEGKILSEALGGLSWDRRQKVAVGIARALKYLHCYCSPGIQVGDLSPDKVIVDLKDEARLRLSLPGMTWAENKSSIFSAYVAPETSESKLITEKSDIYGFGLIMIELLTGKSPTDAEFAVHESIVEWARYCYSDCHLEIWVDPIIKANALNNQNQIVEIMNLALQCTARDPAARPCASDVAKALELVVRLSPCTLGFKWFS